jgi:hypothetical protein
VPFFFKKKKGCSKGNPLIFFLQQLELSNEEEVEVEALKKRRRWSRRS